MRKLYNEFFYIPKQGKIREKVMIVRVAVSAVLMIICLASMSITAYAYFSNNVTSGSNIIKAANFEVKVSITTTGTDGNAVAVNEIQINENDNKTHTFNLEKDKTYEVTLTHVGTASTGFVIVSSTDCQEVYHTQQLGNVEGGRTEVIIFDLSVTADTTVFFVSHWGTSSYYPDYMDKGNEEKLYITNANINNNAVVMKIIDATSSISESDDDKETTSSETTTTTTEPAEVIHTVAAGENLKQIAEQYNTTVERIVAYNQITDSDTIQVEQKLKIPPKDWEVPPEKPKPEEPESEELESETEESETAESEVPETEESATKPSE